METCSDTICAAAGTDRRSCRTGGGPCWAQQVQTSWSVRGKGSGLSMLHYGVNSYLYLVVVIKWQSTCHDCLPCTPR